MFRTGIEAQLYLDARRYGRCVYIVVDSYHEYRVVRLHPESSLFIEENEDAYVRY